MAQPTKFDLKKANIKRARVGKDPLDDFHMREVDGRDEELAANMAKAKGGSATSGEEMVRLAIVAVNGKAVKQPYLAFDTWNQRGRSFALKAFNELNGYTSEESEAFLATAEEEDVPLPSVPAASNETE